MHKAKWTFAMGEIRVCTEETICAIDRIRLEGLPDGAAQSTHLMSDGKAGGRLILPLLDRLRKLDTRH